MLEWEQTTVDAGDPVALGQWWAAALRWVVVNDAPEEFEIRPEPDRLPGILFEPVTDENAARIAFTSIFDLTTRTPRSHA